MPGLWDEDEPWDADEPWDDLGGGGGNGGGSGGGPAALSLPDVETVVVNFLKASADVAALVADRVSTRVPVDPVYPLIRISRVGGTLSTNYLTYLDIARIQVDVIGEGEPNPDEVETEHISGVVEVVLLRDLPGVYDEMTVTDVAEILGRVSVADEVTSNPRYFFEVAVSCHGR